LLDISDVGPYLLDEILHFFQVYKELEPGKLTEPGRWDDRPAAEETVRRAFELYRRTHEVG
ncbi:MAG: inorganic diphosphatase, partial [Acidimicrobiia bacterium]